MFSIKKSLLTVSLAFVLFYPLCISSCSSPKDKVANEQATLLKNEIKNRTYPFLTMTEVLIKEYFKENMRIAIRAKKVQVRNKKIVFFKTPFKKVAHMEDVDVVLYKNNAPVTTIRANYASMDLATNDIIFKRNVSVSNDGRRTIYCDKATWIYEKNEIKVKKRRNQKNRIRAIRPVSTE